MPGASTGPRSPNSGILGAAVPERHGGAGGTVTDLAVLVEAAATALVPGPVLATALAARLLSYAGDASPISADGPARSPRSSGASGPAGWRSARDRSPSALVRTAPWPQRDQRDDPRR